MIALKDIFKPYEKKLMDPRWKSFGLGLRRRCGNACQHCRRRDVQTQVHHIFYESSREPWEYDYDEVVLLCTACHKMIHEELKKFRKFVFGKMNGQALRVLNGALAVALDEYEPLIFVHALASFVSDRRLVEGQAKAWVEFL